MGVIDDIASRLDPTDAEAARTDALTLFGLMLGTLQLARALTDRDLSDQPAPGRRDGHQAAEQPGMTALQTARPLQRAPTRQRQTSTRTSCRVLYAQPRTPMDRVLVSAELNCVAVSVAVMESSRF